MRGKLQINHVITTWVKGKGLRGVFNITIIYDQGVIINYELDFPHKQRPSYIEVVNEIQKYVKGELTV
jgi:hypothetical protein